MSTAPAHKNRNKKKKKKISGGKKKKICPHQFMPLIRTSGQIREEKRRERSFSGERKRRGRGEERTVVWLQPAVTLLINP